MAEQTDKTVRVPATRIFVRCPSWVGDVVMATPVLECLRANYPEAEISVCLRPYLRGILEGVPWVDRFVYVNDKTLGGVLDVRRHVREIRPDLSLLLPNSTRSFLPVWLGGGGQIYGYRRRPLQKFFLAGGPSPKLAGDGTVLPLPMLDYYLGICRSLQLEMPAKPIPRLFVPDELAKQGEGYLREHGIGPDDTVIGLNPGAKFGSTKCWPAEYFAKLSDLLQEKLDCKLLLLVGPGEEGIAEEIQQKASATVINTGPDKVKLDLLKPLVKRCNLLITNDTGPRHYGVAFDVPIVVLFGPTDTRYTDANLDKTVIVRHDVDCAPCHLKVCPRDHRCMTGITPEQVFQEAVNLLQAEATP